ncbi:MAG: hypothetical protein AAF297_11290, partial [Planctomycetota bacterium]
MQHPRPRRVARTPKPLASACVLAVLAIIVSTAVAQFKVPDALTEEQAARFERFESFRINGVCGVRDLDRLQRFGVNTVRGYTIPSGEETRTLLDDLHTRGMKLVVSEWMPHHGENKGRGGAKYDFDYNARGDTMVANFVEKLEAIGDHPAILMWGFGNEVHLDEPYLRTVNRLSKAVHDRFPNHITSLTMINAKPDHIEAIKRLAPDLDVIGVQSYSPGAVRGAIRNMEEYWRKPFYFSEFNGKGPWNFKKTEWGEALDEPVTQKVVDLRACYDAIDASPLSLGSTVFTWGHFGVNRPTYFSLLLSEHPDGPGRNARQADLLMTPQAEVVVERFASSAALENRAPVLTTIETADGARSLTAAPGEPLQIRLAATDADADQVTLQCWILDSKPNRAKTIAGPFSAAPNGLATFKAPETTGEYLIMAYALDGNGGASASTIPLA